MPVTEIASVTRRLLIIPIVHSAADLGSMAPEIERRRRPESAAQIADLWRQLRQHVLDLPLDWSRVHVFQDSLPVCGREMEIVRELAANGSANFALLEEMAARGAVIEGTESPALLLREIEVIRHGTRWSPGTLAALAAERDEFIAHRIDHRLPPNGIGLLFVGMLHQVESYLPETIVAEYPFSITPD